MNRLLLPLLLLALFLGCSSQDAQVQSRLDELEKSIASLSDQVQNLDTRIQDRMAGVEEQLDSLRLDLKNVLEYLSLSLESLRKTARNDGGNLSESAKETIRQNVDRLLDLSGKVLDRLEKELEQGLREKAPETGPGQTR